MKVISFASSLARNRRSVVSSQRKTRVKQATDIPSADPQQVITSVTYLHPSCRLKTLHVSHELNSDCKTQAGGKQNRPFFGEVCPVGLISSIANMSARRIASSTEFPAPRSLGVLPRTNRIQSKGYFCFVRHGSVVQMLQAAARSKATFADQDFDRSKVSTTTNSLQSQMQQQFHAIALDFNVMRLCTLVIEWWTIDADQTAHRTATPRIRQNWS